MTTQTEYTFSKYSDLTLRIKDQTNKRSESKAFAGEAGSEDLDTKYICFKVSREILYKISSFFDSLFEVCPSQTVIDMEEEEKTLFGLLCDIYGSLPLEKTYPPNHEDWWISDETFTRYKNDPNFYINTKNGFRHITDKILLADKWNMKEIFMRNLDILQLKIILDKNDEKNLRHFPMDLNRLVDLADRYKEIKDFLCKRMMDCVFCREIISDNFFKFCSPKMIGVICQVYFNKLRDIYDGVDHKIPLSHDDRSKIIDRLKSKIDYKNE